MNHLCVCVSVYVWYVRACVRACVCGGGGGGVCGGAYLFRKKLHFLFFGGASSAARRRCPRALAAFAVGVVPLPILFSRVFVPAERQDCFGGVCSRHLEFEISCIVAGVAAIGL